MPSVTILNERCKGCELCVGACPKGVIRMAEEINRNGYFYAHVVHPELCTQCRLCAVVCPEVGITMGQKKGVMP